jgi:elongation factor P
MIDVNELRKGITFEFDGTLYKVIDYHHHKPGRGNATIRVKALNMRTGTTLEKTFQSGDRVQDVRLEFHNAQYLYTDGQLYHFMDLDSYEQYAISSEVLGEMTSYLTENLEVKLTFYEGEPLDVELPTSVDMKIIHAEISVRGDTATGVTKRVTTDTGLTVQVPNFVNEGDTIRVDTRNGTYITRV